MCLTMGTKAVYPPGMPAEPWPSLEIRAMTNGDTTTPAPRYHNGDVPPTPTISLI